MTSLAELRCLIFSKKKDPPKIKSLPPTDEAAVQHIRLQVLIWRVTDQEAPPDIDVTQYGWKFGNNVPSRRYFSHCTTFSSVKYCLQLQVSFSMCKPKV